MKESIKQAIKEHKLIAIVRGVEPETCLRIAQALYDGGFRLMEITYDQKCPENWENTAKTIGAVATAFAGKMHVGAGTVTCPELVELTHKYGGQFIISPDANPEVITRTCELGMVSIPGVLTPTEVMIAHRAGADFVKLFPNSEVGISYLKALMAPLSHIRFLAVGGVNEKNMMEYLNAGAKGIGVATGIVNKKHIADGNYAAVTELALAYTSQL